MYSHTRRVCIDTLTHTQMAPFTENSLELKICTHKPTGIQAQAQAQTQEDNVSVERNSKSRKSETESEGEQENRDMALRTM